MRGRLIAVGAVGAILLGPGTAHAHLVTTGLGPVYDGVSHLFVTLEDLLPVVAMALLAGLNGPAAGRRALFSLPVAWLAAGAAGYLGPRALLPAAITSFSLLALGILTATDRRLSPRVVTALAAFLGVLHGWQNGVDLATAGREASGLVGIVAAVCLMLALVSAWVVSLRRPWTRIVVRVAGSWIAAIGLLLLGWALNGRL